MVDKHNVLTWPFLSNTCPGDMMYLKGASTDGIKGDMCAIRSTWTADNAAEISTHQDIVRPRPHSHNASLSICGFIMIYPRKYIFKEFLTTMRGSTLFHL